MGLGHCSQLGAGATAYLALVLQPTWCWCYSLLAASATSHQVRMLLPACMAQVLQPTWLCYRVSGATAYLVVLQGLCCYSLPGCAAGSLLLQPTWLCCRVSGAA